ncbi:MAG: ABC transporter ATP-binding protein [Alphaproteobacteria bacterium]|nr:ABC transporter ATP-binding protein [Alphaproteobacteria bacterium]
MPIPPASAAAEEASAPGAGPPVEGAVAERAVVVQARGLSRRFGRRWALARLDLTVHAGERLLVVGANGSGKSTLLTLLSTLLAPTEGQLSLFGLDPVRDRARVRARIGMVRHAHGLYEDLSARDNLVVRARLLGRPVDVAGLLATVGLDDRVEPLRSYSAGMRKRLQLACVRLEMPDLVLLDEPFSALDPAGCADVAALVGELPGTVLIASHQVDRAAAICTRAILLDGGQLRWSGPADQAWRAWKAVQAQGAAR